MAPRRGSAATDSSNIPPPAIGENPGEQIRDHEAYPAPEGLEPIVELPPASARPGAGVVIPAHAGRPGEVKGSVETTLDPLLSGDARVEGGAVRRVAFPTDAGHVERQIDDLKMEMRDLAQSMRSGSAAFQREMIERFEAIARNGTLSGGVPAAITQAEQDAVRKRSDGELADLNRSLSMSDIRRLVELRGDAEELARWEREGVRPTTHWIALDTVTVMRNGQRSMIKEGEAIPHGELDAATTGYLLDHPEGPKLCRPGQRPKNATVAPVYVPPPTMPGGV